MSGPKVGPVVPPDSWHTGNGAWNEMKFTHYLDRFAVRVNPMDPPFPPLFPVVFGFRNGCWGLGIPEAKPKKNHSNFTIYGKHTQGSNQRLSPACPPNHNQNSNHPISTICPHIETLPKKKLPGSLAHHSGFFGIPLLHITSEPTT